MRKTYSGLVSLDKATAEKIIHQYISPHLTVEAFILGGITIYKAAAGCLDVLCENDWSDRNGRLRVTIFDPLSGNFLWMYFHPENLERDYETEEAKKLETAQHDRREWVLTQGPAHCHKLVDKLWEGG